MTRVRAEAVAPVAMISSSAGIVTSDASMDVTGAGPFSIRMRMTSVPAMVRTPTMSVAVNMVTRRRRARN